MNPFRQQMTHWAVASTDGFGTPVFAAPRRIYTRWEDRAEQFLLPSGEIEVSRAIVFVPDSEWDLVNIGDYVCLGVHSDESPIGLPDAFAVRQRLKTPDLRLVRNEVRLLL